MKNKLFISFSYLLIAVYFLVSWGFPWSEYRPFNTTVSLSYLWDIVFVLVVGALYRLKIKANFHPSFFIRLPLVIGIAYISTFIANYFKFESPFKYIENLFLQLLILAPIIEEFVFRYALYGIVDKLNLRQGLKTLLISSLFSLAHVSALWSLDTEFHSYVYLQLVYTFFLGHLLTKERERSGGVVGPIVLHFSFNLVFYFVVI